MADIRRVILYKHGVGYFEKNIKIKDRQTIDLLFKAREMNDVLKSLTILDLGGGIVSSVSYDSTTPTEKLLEDVTIRIPDENSIKSLLSQIKGARIQITVGKETFHGAVVGLDPITRKEQDTIIQSYRLTILDDSGDMTSFNIEELKALRILDEKIQKDLEFYLKTIIFSQKKDLKNLTIFVTGEGERNLMVSYVLESPVWKTTYRVIVSEQSPPLIQGWAVVDNTQDEDWEDIELSLVSGLPVSFVHDLYNPRFKKRPVVMVKDETSIAPPSFEEGYSEPAPLSPMQFDMEHIPEPLKKSRECSAPAPAPMGGMGLGAGMMPQFAMPMAELSREMASSVEVKTMTQKVGDFFEYRIGNPVTIKRNQSALVPIIHQKFKAERVLIFNESNRPHNPMACLEMTNDTGLTLEGGPVTIFEKDTYLGESMLEFTKPDEKKFIPYAVELGCHIEKMEFNNDEPVYLVTINNGTMRTHFYRIRERTYLIKYKNKDSARLIIEHPREFDWELVDTQAPEETTQNFYRFSQKLPKDGEYSFKVKEKRIFWSHYTLSTLSDDNITYFIGQRFINKEVAESIKKLADLQRNKSEMERELNNRRNEIQSIYKDQERLRSNISTLSTSREEATLKERFVSKLSEQEDLIEKHQKAVVELQEKIEKSTVEISSMIVNLQCEIKL
ncbi:MAG: hypothetical protein AB2L14_35405 [Candidatus Xenobiia bacterium LiM19]